MANTFRFDSEFQDSILAHFVADPERFLCYGEVLKPSYFEGAQATVVAYGLLDYLRQYGKPPAWPVLRQLALDKNKKLSLCDDREALDYVSHLQDLDTGDGDYIVTRVIDFARERATLEAVRQSLDLLKEGKTPPDGFVSLFQEASQVGQNLSDMGLLFHADYQKVIDMVVRTDYGTPTGYRQWDKIWKRGWGPGWLIVILAPPKRYKTALALNLALNIISPMIEGDVLYYPCEITQELAFVRGLTNITQKSTDYLYENPAKFSEAVGEAMKVSCAGNLIVKGYPAGSVTLTTIRNHARLAVKHFKIKKLKAIIIDYADTVLPSGSFDAEYLRQAAVYTEARGIGAEFRCPIIMPDRTTREATDKRVPDMKAFQGAFAKGGIVDAAIGLCMTEDEYAENILRSFIFINRHGSAFHHFRGRVDPETMYIDIGEEIPYEPDEDTPFTKPKRRKKGMPPELDE